MATPDDKKEKPTPDDENEQLWKKYHAQQQESERRQGVTTIPPEEWQDYTDLISALRLHATKNPTRETEEAKKAFIDEARRIVFRCGVHQLVYGKKFKFAQILHADKIGQVIAHQQKVRKLDSFKDRFPALEDKATDKLREVADEACKGFGDQNTEYIREQGKDPPAGNEDSEGGDTDMEDPPENPKSAAWDPTLVGADHHELFSQIFPVCLEFCTTIKGTINPSEQAEATTKFYDDMKEFNEKVTQHNVKMNFRRDLGHIDPQALAATYGSKKRTDIPKRYTDWCRWLQYPLSFLQVPPTYDKATFPDKATLMRAYEDLFPNAPKPTQTKATPRYAQPGMQYATQMHGANAFQYPPLQPQANWPAPGQLQPQNTALAQFVPSQALGRSNVPMMIPANQIISTSDLMPGYTMTGKSKIIAMARKMGKKRNRKADSSSEQRRYVISQRPGCYTITREGVLGGARIFAVNEKDRNILDIVSDVDDLPDREKWESSRYDITYLWTAFPPETRTKSNLDRLPEIMCCLELDGETYVASRSVFHQVVNKTFLDNMIHQNIGSVFEVGSLKEQLLQIQFQGNNGAYVPNQALPAPAERLSIGGPVQQPAVTQRLIQGMPNGMLDTTTGADQQLQRLAPNIMQPVGQNAMQPVQPIQHMQSLPSLPSLPSQQAMQPMQHMQPTQHIQSVQPMPYVNPYTMLMPQMQYPYQPPTVSHYLPQDVFSLAAQSQQTGMGAQPVPVASQQPLATGFGNLLTDTPPANAPVLVTGQPAISNLHMQPTVEDAAA